MMEEFKTKEELYERVKPALYSKVKEYKRKNISYIKEVDIWNYLSKNVWSKKENLSLSMIVNDILELSDEEIKGYMFEKLRKQDRYLESEREELL